MNCNNCGQPNDADSNYCKHCGDNLKGAADVALNPHGTIFSSPTKSNTELGYLIIALLIIFNVCLWFFWTFVFNSLADGNKIVYKATRMFIVMFIFAKRQSYRIVIGIIAGLVIIYDLFYLIRLLSDLDRF